VELGADEAEPLGEPGTVGGVRRREPGRDGVGEVLEDRRVLEQQLAAIGA
jgi:hypothetical protein